MGIHYHKNYLTPYWDAEGGIALDGTYQHGLPIFGNSTSFDQVYGQAAMVKRMPRLAFLGDGPILDWLRSTRWAFRLGGAAALPAQRRVLRARRRRSIPRLRFEPAPGQHHLGRQRRMARAGLHQPVAGMSATTSPAFAMSISPRFYDIGDAYVSGHSSAPPPTPSAPGLRVDVAWLGLIERTILRFDIAKAIGGDTPVQFWFGVQHPF